VISSEIFNDNSIFPVLWYTWSFTRSLLVLQFACSSTHLKICPKVYNRMVVEIFGKVCCWPTKLTLHKQTGNNSEKWQIFSSYVCVMLTVWNTFIFISFPVLLSGRIFISFGLWQVYYLQVSETSLVKLRRFLPGDTYIYINKCSSTTPVFLLAPPVHATLFFCLYKRCTPVLLAARSKTEVCDYSPAEIVVSNPIWDMDVCLLCVVK
jgi:hypothetical protein